MKKKTFSRLKIFALSLLLAEAMALLVLLLAQTGASAEVGGIPGMSHKGTTHGAGNSVQGMPGGSGDQGADNSFFGRHWGEAADFSDLPDGAAPDNFNGAGSSGGGGQGGNSHASDPSMGGSSHFFPGFSGPGGSHDDSGHGAGDGSQGGDAPGGNDFGTEGGEDFTGDLNNFAKTDIADGTDDGGHGDDSHGGGKDGDSDGPAGLSNLIRSADLAPTAVPEPVSASLLLAGLAGAVLVRRRRRARA